MAKQVHPGDSIAIYCGEITDSQPEDEELFVVVPPPSILGGESAQTTGVSASWIDNTG